MVQSFGTADKKALKVEKYLMHSVQMRASWMKEALENTQFYLGDQWTQEERKYLEDRARFPLTLNIIQPNVDGFVALLASNRPRFKAVSSNVNGKRLANVAEFILEYIWYISKGSRELVRALLDYSNAGIGWMIPDIDPTADFGQGEVKVLYLPWFKVHWDSRAEMPGYRDRSWTLVFNTITAGAAAAKFGKEDLCRAAADMNWSNSYYQPGRDLTSATSEYQVFLPGDMPQYPVELDETWKDREIPLLEMYEYVYVKAWSILNPEVGYEQYYTETDFETLKVSPAIKNNAFKVTIPRVKKTVTIGGWKVLYEKVLPVTILPPIPIARTTTSSAYPRGLTSRAKDPQREHNKRRLAMIENAQVSAVGRVLAPRNSMDRSEYELYSRLPGGLTFYDPQMDSAGGSAPIIPLPSQQLPSQFFYLDQQAVPTLEYITGVNSMFWGEQNNMPETYRQTLVLEEYSNRRIKAIDMVEIDSALQDMGQVALELSQWLYNSEKVLTIVDDDGPMREMIINHPKFDAKGNIEYFLNDIRNFYYSVKIIPGSTMPMNQYAEVEMLMSLMDRGLPLEEEVLKKLPTTIDVDAVLERASQLNQARSAIEQLQEQNKEQKGMIQTLQRMLTTMKIKLDSREMSLLLELETKTRMMEEHLATAELKLATRNYQENIRREERHQRNLGEVKTKNLISMVTEQLKASARTESSK